MVFLSAITKNNFQINQSITDLFLLQIIAPEIAKKVNPGQFIMLKVSVGNDPLLARPFSVYNAEGEEIEIIYRVTGKATRLLSQIKKNEKITLWGPLGKGFNLFFNQLAIIGGGVGYAPLAFTASFFAKHNKPPRYFGQGGQNKQYVKPLLLLLQKKLINSEIVEDIATLKLNKTNNLWLISTKNNYIQNKEDTNLIHGTNFNTAIFGATIDGSFGKYGTIVDHFKDFLIKFYGLIDGIFACGPIAMLKAVAKISIKYKIPCQAAFEAPMACGIGACLSCVLPSIKGGYIQLCQEGPVIDINQVDWDRL